MPNLRDEEKEHVAECMEYIRRLDAVQDRMFELDIDAHIDGAEPQRRLAPPAEKPRQRRWALTVGSLRKT